MNARGLTVLFVILGMFVSSCSSKKDRAQREHDTSELQALKAQLQPGLEFSKVQELSPKMGNCTGSPEGAQRCEAQYLISVARALPGVTSPNPDPATAKYTKVTFDFLKGKLVRWQESEDLVKSSW